MRQLTKLLVAFAVLALFATACGSDGGGGDSGDVATDFGVDAENKIIRVGLNADLSGPFASLVSEIVAAQEVYWEVFNEEGGYQGWTVETVVLDSGYQTDVGLQNYRTLAAEDGVLMITENTGSPITNAIREEAADDDMVVIPLSWASIWPDPELGSAILEKGTTYCAESMNGVEWLADYAREQGLEPSLAIVGRPGEYGEDGSAGAKIAAEELGIPIVYDGTGATSGDDRSNVISGVVGSGATIVWTTLTPGELLDIFGNSVSQGFTGYWSGNSPSFNYLVHLQSDFAADFDQYYFQSGYYAPWGAPGEGNDIIQEEMRARRPDLNISDVYASGWIEGLMAEALFTEGIDQGDLTRANMIEIANSGLEVDFLGLGEDQAWPPDYNDAIVRSSWIYDVDVSQFNVISAGESTADNLGSSGLIPVGGSEFTGDLLKDYQFDGPCIEGS